MKVNRNQATALKGAIEYWNVQGLLDEKTASALQQDIEVVPFDWKRLAKYSFWIALFCIISSVSAALADEVLIELFESIFHAPYIVKCIVSSGLSGIIFWVGIRRRAIHPHKIFSNEAILFVGVVSTACTIYQLGRVLHMESSSFIQLLLFSFIVYGILGFSLRSNLIWLFALLSLGSWMGAQTGYASGGGIYYLGMNYPLRFAFFGGILIAIALLLEKKNWFDYFFRSTLAVGLLHLFISLWMMSIFGNFGVITSWDKIRQIDLFFWSLSFGLASCAAIFHGLRFDNGMTKGFGITFLIINLYTRFLEYFWDSTHKAIVFGLLGVSFWFLGSRAEKIWHLGLSPKKP